ncbi:CopG family transcriptional regulator [Halovenus sp. WSH3]|uniref:CopG family transcriptional regulator n=1 Tax=Halovenus carboxidivorans TaxID=2692199 RepID=A0A6B0T080_9EURY|nr:ribbon-helix-helix domain-containing protein [Halovenus carboxidivorans]MXR51558.1 CopG family transcriptional regulator [Halovenus carboxidivorans]
MSGEHETVSVPLPDALAARLDTLVEADVFESRAEALRYGARLVVREEARADTPLEVEKPPADDSPPGRGGGGGRSAQE